MPLLRAAVGLIYCYRLIKKIKKNYTEKNYCNLQYFQETTTKIILEKKHKKNKRKKKPCRKIL